MSKLKLESKIQSRPIMLKAYSGFEIKTLGQISLKWEIKNKIENLKFIVIKKRNTTNTKTWCMFKIRINKKSENIETLDNNIS